MLNFLNCIPLSSNLAERKTVENFKNFDHFCPNTFNPYAKFYFFNLTNQILSTQNDEKRKSKNYRQGSLGRKYP